MLILENASAENSGTEKCGTGKDQKWKMAVGYSVLLWKMNYSFSCLLFFVFGGPFISPPDDTDFPTPTEHTLTPKVRHAKTKNPLKYCICCF